MGRLTVRPGMSLSTDRLAFVVRLEDDDDIISGVGLDMHVEYESAGTQPLHRNDHLKVLDQFAGIFLDLA